MNQSQQSELRSWADALSRADGERAAMGRAILMLLDRIEELERELSERTVPVSMEEQFRLDDESADQVEFELDEDDGGTRCRSRTPSRSACATGSAAPSLRAATTTTTTRLRGRRVAPATVNCTGNCRPSGGARQERQPRRRCPIPPMPACRPLRRRVLLTVRYSFGPTPPLGRWS